MRKNRLNWLPTKEQIEANPRLRFLKKYMHRQTLFELNRSTVSRAVFVGIFAAFLPMPFQSVISAILAILLRSNLIIAIALVWISNPFTMFPFLYASYLVGAKLMGVTAMISFNQINLDLIVASWNKVFLPIFFGSVILGLASGTILAILVWLFFSLFPPPRNQQNK